LGEMEGKRAQKKKHVAPIPKVIRKGENLPGGRRWGQAIHLRGREGDRPSDGRRNGTTTGGPPSIKNEGKKKAGGGLNGRHDNKGRKRGNVPLGVHGGGTPESTAGLGAGKRSLGNKKGGMKEVGGEKGCKKVGEVRVFLRRDELRGGVRPAVRDKGKSGGESRP